MTAVAIIHRDSIIEQLALGKRLSDLQLPVDISPQAISKALRTDKEYRDAIHLGFHKRLDQAEDDLESATEQVDVARARARFQSVAWRAEREFPEQWASKQEVSLTATITVEHVLKVESTSLLESIRASQQSEVIDVTPEDDA